MPSSISLRFFFVLGFGFILLMAGKRRRDVLHGPYVTKPRMARQNIHIGRLEGANAIDELSRIVRDIEGESEMSTAKLQELEEVAGKLLATARKLPPGSNRHNALQLIGRFRAQIAVLQNPDLFGKNKTAKKTTKQKKSKRR